MNNETAHILRQFLENISVTQSIFRNLKETKRIHSKSFQFLNNHKK